MVEKKGWLRIVEATVCTLIIIGIVIFVYRNGEKTSESYEDKEMHLLLDEVAKDDNLRFRIINSSDKEEIENTLDLFIKERIKNNNLNLSVKICGLGDVLGCMLGTEGISKEREIYASSRIISTYLNNTPFDPDLTPKKVKLYVWEIY